MASHADPTVRNYRPLQAQQYAQTRTSYPLGLYNYILEHHASTTTELNPASNPFGFLLDVGCGPGNATRDLASAFDHAVGIDPGKQMIAAARKMGGKTRIGEEVRFEECSAEECDSVPGVSEGQVDLLVAAMAAHWFDMAKFWQRAARVVKSGGTVALWTISETYPHPSTPYAEEVSRILIQLRGKVAPFEAEGNRLSRDLYDRPALPWMTNPEQASFPKEKFQCDKITLEWFEKGLETVSMVTRWREANPELAGMEKDVVKETIEALRLFVGGKKFKLWGGTVILLFKRA